MRLMQHTDRKLHAAIDSILKEFRNASTKGIKSIDADTHHQRGQIVHRVYSEISSLGFKIRNPEGLKQKHLRAWVEACQDNSAICEDTLKQYCQHMAVFCGWLKKEQHRQMLFKGPVAFQRETDWRKQRASVKSRCFSSLKRILEKDNQNKRHAILKKDVGFSTSGQREEFYYRFFRELIEMRYRLPDVEGLRKEHIRAWMQDLEFKGRSPKTLQKYASMINVFTVFINKPGMMGNPRDLLKDPSRFECTSVTKTDKSQANKKVQWNVILEKVKARSQVLAAQYVMCERFGLRFEEAAKLCPHISDKGDYLHICKGSKGGRKRNIEIRTADQRQALDHLKTFATSKNGSTIPKNKNYKQWNTYSNNINRDVGFTKKEAGFTRHSLRHGFANDLYQELTGISSPVRGGNPESIRASEDLQARLFVAQEMGHGRARITSAYTGSRQGNLDSGE